MDKLWSALSILAQGKGLRARAIRGSALTLVSFGGSNILRLFSNLLLTRLLMPEAFGLMALVTVFTVGLKTFSDMGVSQAIIQNKLGDRPEFLDTAWTMQILRGAFLWICTCLIAIPAARIYDEPMLAALLPVVGLNMLVSGWSSTRLITLNKHLMLGRLTALQLGTKLFEILIMIVLALVYKSVWALVIGGLASTILMAVLSHVVLPGHRNRLHWDWQIAKGLFHFGKYLFLSTIAGFFLSQGDRAVLGMYLNTADLGIYSIAALWGTVPLVLGRALAGKVVFPLFSKRPPSERVENRRNLLLVRRMVIGSLLVANAILAFVGIDLINLLYDDRYTTAGPIIILFCLSIVPQLSVIGYTAALISAGDSKRFCVVSVISAVIQVALLLWLVPTLGVVGAILSSGIATLATHPLRAYYVAKYSAWDPVGDACFIGGGLFVTSMACYYYWDSLSALIS